MKLANLIKLHVAAFHFAKSPDCTAQKLAQLTDVKIKTVYGWVQRPEWHAALDALHFTGDRAFARKPTRDTIRDAGGLVEEAFEIYKTARMDGHTQKKPSPKSSTRWNLTADVSIPGRNVTNGRRD